MLGCAMFLIFYFILNAATAVCSSRSALKLKPLCYSYIIDRFTWNFNRGRQKIGHKFYMEHM